MTHAQLVERAVRWLRSYRCGVVLSEQACVSGEMPDALGWKQAGRGAVDGRRPEDATPAFAEMAAHGTAFEGEWRENSFLNREEVRQVLRDLSTSVPPKEAETFVSDSRHCMTFVYCMNFV